MRATVRGARPSFSFCEAGGKGAMAAHNAIDGQPCHANARLLNGVFRDELGFGDGIVISDCNDIEVQRARRRASPVRDAAFTTTTHRREIDADDGQMSRRVPINHAQIKHKTVTRTPRSHQPRAKTQNSHPYAAFTSTTRK